MDLNEDLLYLHEHRHHDISRPPSPTNTIELDVETISEENDLSFSKSAESFEDSSIEGPRAETQSSSTETRRTSPTTTGYEFDHIRYLKEKEKLLPTFRRQSPQFHRRPKMIAMIKNICSGRMSLTTTYLAVSLLDRFMDNHEIKEEHLNLTCLTAVAIASKFEERDDRILTYRKLNLFCGDKPYRQNIFPTMEELMLKFFKFDFVSYVTPAVFAELFFLRALNINDCICAGSDPAISTSNINSESLQTTPSPARPRDSNELPRTSLCKRKASELCNVLPLSLNKVFVSDSGASRQLLMGLTGRTYRVVNGVGYEGVKFASDNSDNSATTLCTAEVVNEAPEETSNCKNDSCCSSDSSSSGRDGGNIFRSTCDGDSSPYSALPISSPYFCPYALHSFVQYFAQHNDTEIIFFPCEECFQRYGYYATTFTTSFVHPWQSQVSHLENLSCSQAAGKNSNLEEEVFKSDHTANESAVDQPEDTDSEPGRQYGDFSDISSCENSGNEDISQERKSERENISRFTYAKTSMLSKKISWKSVTLHCWQFLMKYLDLCIDREELIAEIPSKVAAACILLSRMDCCIFPAWQSFLESMTGYREQELRRCAAIIIGVDEDQWLANTPDSGYKTSTPIYTPTKRDATSDTSNI